MIYQLLQSHGVSSSLSMTAQREGGADIDQSGSCELQMSANTSDIISDELYEASFDNVILTKSPDPSKLLYHFANW